MLLLWGYNICLRLRAPHRTQPPLNRGLQHGIAQCTHLCLPLRHGRALRWEGDDQQLLHLVLRSDFHGDFSRKKHQDLLVTVTGYIHKWSYLCVNINIYMSSIYLLSYECQVIDDSWDMHLSSYNKDCTSKHMLGWFIVDTYLDECVCRTKW